MSPADGTSLPSIDELSRPTHDELARQRFVSSLRKRIMVDLAQGMREVYAKEVEPKFRAKNGRKPRDGREVRRAMLDHPYFQAWSALRYTAQELTWWTVIPQVERNLDTLIDTARRAAKSKGPGSLRLNPDLPIPRDVTAMDIHLMPGCFHSEFRPDDVAMGALYWHGTHVFSSGLKLRVKNGGVARSIGEWIKARHPQLQPKRLLDLGCTDGSNLFPYFAPFPDLEGHGVDVGAPALRFGHAIARARGLNVHFSQQDARALDFPDNHFDVVTSSFFLHEQSLATNRKVLREAWRVLRPGGLMVHMELPPASECDPYYNFYLDWDAFYNNEPHYAGFRALDFRREVIDAGFSEKNYFARRIPNYGTLPHEEFVDSALGRRPAPAHGNGASWFIFGAWK